MSRHPLAIIRLTLGCWPLGALSTFPFKPSLTAIRQIFTLSLISQRPLLAHRPVPSFLLHFCCSGLAHMSSDHQSIAVRICYSPATVAPKHIHDWHDSARPKLDGFGHDFIGVLDRQVQGQRRAAECFGAPYSAIWILGSEHERGTAESQFCVHG